MKRPAASAAMSYSDYLQLDKLLDAQKLKSAQGGSAAHDETLFIIVHQAYELWFKQMLHETGHLQARLEADDVPAGLATFKRMLTILKVLVSQIDVLETMTPISFNSFRTRLDTASGFESAQFRAFEFALGHKRPGAAARYAEGSAERAMLDEAMGRPSLWDSFLRLLASRGYAIPESALRRDVTQPIGESAEVQDALLEIYRRDPLLSQVCERLVDLDEGLQEWRYRHVKMVERTIGTKRGTGGSAGAEYLRTTLFRPLFPDLWAIRVRL